MDNFKPLPVDLRGMSGSVKNNQVWVTPHDSPCAIPSTSLLGRKTMIVHNSSAFTVYLGDDHVATTSGLPLAAGAYLFLDVGTAVLYGVCGDDNAELRVLEVS